MWCYWSLHLYVWVSKLVIQWSLQFHFGIFQICLSEQIDRNVELFTPPAIFRTVTIRKRDACTWCYCKPYLDCISTMRSFKSQSCTWCCCKPLSRLHIHLAKFQVPNIRLNWIMANLESAFWRFCDSTHTWNNKPAKVKAKSVIEVTRKNIEIPHVFTVSGFGLARSKLIVLDYSFYLKKTAMAFQAKTFREAFNPDRLHTI